MKPTSDAKVVEFSPVSEGQKIWEASLAAELRAYLPVDKDEARQIVAIMAAAVDREGRQSWAQRRLAAYILGILPDDQGTARRIVSQLFWPDDAA